MPKLISHVLLLTGVALALASPSATAEYYLVHSPEFVTHNEWMPYPPCSSCTTCAPNFACPQQSGVVYERGDTCRTDGYMEAPIETDDDYDWDRRTADDGMAELSIN